MSLYVPKIMQNPGMPWGCSVVSLTQALNFKGYNLDKTYMGKTMTYASNPYKGYVGSPFRSQQGDPNLIYPEGLIAQAKKYRPDSEVINGISESQIKSELRQGNPVLVWVVHKFRPLRWKWYYSGANRLYAPVEYHVIALTGYNESTNQYLFVDTVGSQRVSSVSEGKFNLVFDSFDRRSIVVR